MVVLEQNIYTLRAPLLSISIPRVLCVVLRICGLCLVVLWVGVVCARNSQLGVPSPWPLYSRRTLVTAQCGVREVDCLLERHKWGSDCFIREFSAKGRWGQSHVHRNGVACCFSTYQNTSAAGPQTSTPLMQCTQMDTILNHFHVLPTPTIPFVLDPS